MQGLSLTASFPGGGARPLSLELRDGRDPAAAHARLGAFRDQAARTAAKMEPEPRLRLEWTGGGHGGSLDLSLQHWAERREAWLPVWKESAQPCRRFAAPQASRHDAWALAATALDDATWVAFAESFHGPQAAWRRVAAGEASRYRARLKGFLWYGYFNNFFLRLPLGYMRDFPAEIRSARLPLPRNSRLRRRLTMDEFHREIDRAVADAGLDHRRITALQRETVKIRLLDYALPAYLRLRELGYWRYPDLTA